MNILKKKHIKKINNNYLDIYKFYLKNLNFYNNFKKRNNILLKNILLLKLDNLYLININLKENFFFYNVEKNKNIYKNKNHFLYFFEYYDNYLKKLKINIEYFNYSYNTFYLNFLNNRIKRFFISRIFIKKNNKIKKFYITKFNLCYDKLKKMIKSSKEKKIYLQSFGKIYYISKKNLNIKKIKIKNIKNKYLIKRLKKRFSFENRFNIFLKNKRVFFKIKIIYIKNKMKFYFFRKKYEKDKIKTYLNRIKINLKNLKKKY